ncbi:zinc-ribbon domain-containing protein [Candidatus Woesearchaeota archaeon]|nr:zinc-ribbon domain-containing protein [Candidatus Woesearchaeota archaeon]MBT6518655.1 zinc-ribbon domain-containing protein [Candidatus Woesearchaeota archaeon]MBT7368845.1 zinc-ribbon domain-containing protein [Candidatus Woesearchaeota archaeon]
MSDEKEEVNECPFCGTNVEETDEYCIECGTDLKEQETCNY